MAAREAAEAGREMAEAAQRSLETSLSDSAAMRDERAAAKQELLDAGEALREAVRQVSEMIWQHSVSAAAFRNDQQELLNEAKETVNAVRGLTRTAQAASAAAQRDSARILTIAKAQRGTVPEAISLEQTNAASEAADPRPAEAAVPPTPWEELELDMAIDRPPAEAEGDFWTVAEYFEEDHLAATEEDDDAPLLGRIWTRIRHKVD